MITDDTDSRQELIATHKLRLAELHKQRAYYGIAVDPHITIEINKIEAEIKQLQTEIRNQILLDRKRLNVFKYITEKLEGINSGMIDVACTV